MPDPHASSDLVPEQALDYDEILRRGGANCGDEDFALFKCPNCGQVYLMEYEVDTVYLNPADLSQRVAVYDSSFPCIACGQQVPNDTPWIGRRQDRRFAVTWANLAASGWKWMTQKTRPVHEKE
jgi:predicted RNA-binding Zn-ribbon protein involved in translation (DUF1610 family)